MKIPTLLALASVLIIAASSSAQAIPQRNQILSSGSQSHRLPNPVRDIPHEVDQVSASPAAAHRDLIESMAGPVYLRTATATASPAHRVIVSPERSLYAGHRTSPRKANSLKRMNHRRPVQPEPATIPDARRRETWKTPYSYGHFGASRSRQWTLQYGYRDRMTEWRLQ